jgi:hypothetical protein
MPVARPADLSPRHRIRAVKARMNQGRLQSLTGDGSFGSGAAAVLRNHCSDPVITHCAGGNV